ncbi:MAG: 50S ribosomal protein L9, partial [Actinobacteria bacterium]|nr:50S ribosomal protein L9 [Actinomycetota bacterium]
VTSPIKTIGSHRVSVRLHPEVSAALDVEVIAS